MSQYQLFLAGNGYQVVSTAGTAVQFSTTNTPCNWVQVYANSTNTNVVVIGTSTANCSTGANRSGYPLAATENQLFPAANLNSIWFDGVSTQGISFVYYRTSMP